MHRHVCLHGACVGACPQAPCGTLPSELEWGSAHKPRHPACSTLPHLGVPMERMLASISRASCARRSATSSTPTQASGKRKLSQSQRSSTRWPASS